VSARYWSEAAKERSDPACIFYFWRGERPRHPNAPQLEGTWAGRDPDPRGRTGGRLHPDLDDRAPATGRRGRIATQG
jgi:hypothetical protein